MVVGSLESQPQVSDIRTSSGTFLDKGADRVVKAVEQRLSEWTFLPVPNQEQMQVNALRMYCRKGGVPSERTELHPHHAAEIFQSHRRCTIWEERGVPGYGPS